MTDPSSDAGVRQRDNQAYIGRMLQPYTPVHQAPDTFQATPARDPAVLTAQGAGWRDWSGRQTTQLFTKQVPPYDDDSAVRTRRHSEQQGPISITRDGKHTPAAPAAQTPVATAATPPRWPSPAQVILPPLSAIRPPRQDDDAAHHTRGPGCSACAAISPLVDDMSAVVASIFDDFDRPNDIPYATPSVKHPNGSSLLRKLEEAVQRTRIVQMDIRRLLRQRVDGRQVQDDVDSSSYHDYARKRRRSSSPVRSPHALLSLPPTPSVPSALFQAPTAAALGSKAVHRQAAPDYSTYSTAYLDTAGSRHSQSVEHGRRSIDESSIFSSSLAPPSSTTTFGILSTSTEAARSKGIQRQADGKTPSAQTLQDEYSNLLQKFNRERARNQSVEKKAISADKEINSLSLQNEELQEQIKGYEASMLTYETKIDEMRSDYNRAKTQWVSMLSNGNKMMSRAFQDRRGQMEEKTRLETTVDRLKAMVLKGGPPHPDAQALEALLMADLPQPTSRSTRPTAGGLSPNLAAQPATDDSLDFAHDTPLKTERPSDEQSAFTTQAVPSTTATARTAADSAVTEENARLRTKVKDLSEQVVSLREALVRVKIGGEDVRAQLLAMTDTLNASDDVADKVLNSTR